MPPPNAHVLVAKLEQTLADQGVDVEQTVSEFGQLRACEERERGKQFFFHDHLRGLLLSLLSSQRRWGPIADNLGRIERIFLGYDPERVRHAEPEELVANLTAMSWGNRAIGKQMGALAGNIAVLEQIERDFGSLDAFVTSGKPNPIAKRLSRPGKYKLKQVGFALAMEYLRNVGIPAGKPDVHVCRVVGEERLGYARGVPSPTEGHRIIDELASEAGCNPVYLDNILWMFCAADYGRVCGAQPRCEVCRLREWCNFPSRGESG